jgi:hypothetical protein
MIGDFLRCLVRGSKIEGQYCVVGDELLQMVSEPLPSLRWEERAQACESCQRALTGTLRMG